eukprot:snap_masked-scaffold_21-processed-gene-5.63-mRNA-1 protein AED:1.00 eAED:1.00 QI:0/0/0/0/1/1/2/0/76
MVLIVYGSQGHVLKSLPCKDVMFFIYDRERKTRYDFFALFYAKLSLRHNLIQYKATTLSVGPIQRLNQKIELKWEK